MNTQEVNVNSLHPQRRCQGYSRLMGEDEERLQDPERIQRDYEEPHPAASGRIVGAPGDNVLADSSAWVDAVPVRGGNPTGVEGRKNGRAAREPKNGVSDWHQPWGCDRGRRFDLREWSEHCGPAGRLGRARRDMYLGECVRTDREQAALRYEYLGNIKSEHWQGRCGFTGPKLSRRQPPRKRLNPDNGKWLL